MLEADVYNLSMGGSCYVEPAIADFIAERDNWDFATFELGINLVRATPDNTRFAEKVNYLLDRVYAHHPRKPVFLITIFNNGIYHEVTETDWLQDVREKNEILRAAPARHPGKVTLLDGRDIAPDLRGFQTDLLHPEPFAATRMGLRLAERLAPLLAQAGF